MEGETSTVVLHCYFDIPCIDYHHSQNPPFSKPPHLRRHAQSHSGFIATGVPNTLNVVTSFPFLIVGIVGLVISVCGNSFQIGSKGEIWGWAFFYSGIAGLAFGSAYYHLDPGDDRVVWDQLPVLVSISSLSSVLLMERVDGQMGITCLFSLIIFSFISIQYGRDFDDLRLCMIVQFVSCLAIPAIILLFPPKYTHSSYWVLVAGLYLLARFEAIYDKKVYRVNHYVISGHSLEHLCLAAIPIFLSIMLCFRNIKIQRNC